MDRDDFLFRLTVDCLKPLTDMYCDGNTFVSDEGVDERSLILLRPTHCRLIEHKDIRVSKYAVNQQCHAVSAWEWLNNPELKYMLGFTYIDHTWYMHSFLIDTDDCIVEPTPITREMYWGRPYTKEETYFLVAEELNKMRELNFPLEEKHRMKLLNYMEH